MTDIVANNKRIAKNTLMLYGRTGIIMVVLLFTSRLLLNTLGVVDYGVYNVVAGVITMFSFINGAMASATSRNITFALGKKDPEVLHKVFCTCVNIHLIVAGIIFVLGETVGLWYMYKMMVIPAERFSAAMWVYQCSVVSAIVLIISVPYNACIIAHEKMSAFAYISLIGVLLKPVIIYLLIVSPFDRLAFFAILTLIVDLAMRFIYLSYCHRHFPESKYKRMWDKKLIKEMSSFAGWSLFGNLSGVAFTTGVNLLLNFFFGPVVNAARAIAVQVQGVITQFIANFQMALNPQITKSYAAGEFDFMYSLVYRSARFSFFLLMIFTIPIQIEAETILRIWLKTVPDNTMIFLRIILCTGLVYTMSNPLIILAHATGKIRKYQVTAGGVMLTVVPIAYICLRLGLPPYSVFVVHFVIESIDLFVRIFLLRGMVKLSVRAYLQRVILVIVPVATLSYIPPLIVHHYVCNELVSLISVCVISVFTSSAAIYYLGLTRGERKFIRGKVAVVYHKFIR